MISVTPETADPDAGSAAGRRHEWNDYIEGERRSSGFRDQHARWRTSDERRALAVETRVPHEQPGRHLNADPPLLQDIDSQPRFPAHRIGRCAEGVVHSRQRGIDWRRPWFWRRRQRPGAQGAIVIEGEHDPAIR
jgi:hypothetical protein